MKDRVFDELVRKHEAALTTYARSIARDFWSAEEAVQGTLVRAWRYIDTFDGRGSFEGWLLRICRNVVIDNAHAQSLQPIPAENNELDRVAGSVGHDDSLGIVDLLQQLSVDHREILVLVGVLGVSYEEAAMTLDVPIGTVRSRLGRARESFGRLLAASEVDSATQGAA